MATPGFLGEFELLALLAVLQRGGDAYGVTIREEIVRRTDRPVSRGALYVTLERLVTKGYLASTLAAGGSDRDGRARRFYRVERPGIDAIRASRQAVDRMAEGLDPLLEVS